LQLLALGRRQPPNDDGETALSTPVFTARQMREIRARAEHATIAVLTLEELRAGRLPVAALRTYALREPLRNPARLAELDQRRAELSPVERGWMLRQDLREAVFAS
jgi:hypothetical protein